MLKTHGVDQHGWQGALARHVERLWRSVKYEDIYLRAYDTPAALACRPRYFDFYARRRHTALDRRTPDAVYFDEVAQAA